MKRSTREAASRASGSSSLHRGTHSNRRTPHTSYTSAADTGKQLRLNKKRKGKGKGVVEAADTNSQTSINRPAGQRPKPKPRRNIPTDQVTEACSSVTNQSTQALHTSEGASGHQSPPHGCGAVVVRDPSLGTTSEDVPSGGQENEQCSSSTKRRRVDVTGPYPPSDRRKDGRGVTQTAAEVEAKSSHDGPNVQETSPNLAHENQPTRSSLRLQQRREHLATKPNK
jgi:hypothetical protein